jgi:hypothetical protein
MDSLDPKCTQLKLDYEQCFYQWYTEHFLVTTIDLTPKHGRSPPVGEDPRCTALFAKYRACIEPTLRKLSISPSSPDSMSSSPSLPEAVD